MSKCIVCDTEAIVRRQINDSRTIYNCPYCGVFVVSDLVEDEVKSQAAQIASYLVSRKIAGRNETVYLSYKNAPKDPNYIQFTVSQIVDQYPQTMTQTIYMILKNLTKMSSYVGEEIKIEGISRAPLFYLKKLNFDALSYMIKLLQSMEYVEVKYYANTFFPCGIIVSPKGWDLVLHADKDFLISQNAYIIPPVGDLRLDFEEAVTQVITQCNFEHFQRHATSKNYKIGYDLVADVKRSRLVVCDLSESNHDALFVAGMSHCIDQICILTCHRSMVRNIPFATTINVVIWDDKERLYDDLFHMVLSKLL